MTTGGSGIAATTGRSAFNSSLRFRVRANRERNDGHIFGATMAGANDTPLSATLGAAPAQPFSLPATRFTVPQSRRGGRVPMVFTQVTG